MLRELKFRSPLTLRRLQQAGHSLESLLRDLTVERALPWLYVPAFLLALALLEWVRFVFEWKPAPWAFTALAAAGAGLAFFKLRPLVLEARRSRLGQDGERAVADTLQGLVAEGWQVFHDVPGDGCNVDHVAIGPSGIFTIQTKTRSEPEGKRVARIVVERAGVSVAGAPPSHELLDRASAHATWLAELLKSSTGKPFRVRSVLLFPGGHVTQKSPRRANDPWVLETRAFVKWLQRERTALTEEQIALASVHLNLYLRREWRDRRAPALEAPDVRPDADLGAR
jgi:hypothetical protein